MNSKLIDIQLDAFNKKDINRFLACYHDESQAFMLDTGEVLTTGKEELQKAMVQSFRDKPDAVTSVMETIVQKDMVVNLEKIENYIEGKVIKVLTLYEVKDNLITRVWFSNRTITE